MSANPPHDEFLRLCAVAASGQLSREERRKLEQHLEDCSACREVMEQYEAIVGHVIPAMAPEFLGEEEFDEPVGSDREYSTKPTIAGSATGFLSCHLTNWHFLSYGAAAALLLVLGSILTYKVGVRQGAVRETAALTIAASRAVPVQGTADDSEKKALQEQLNAGAGTIQELRLQLDQQSALVARLRNQRTQLESQLQQGSSGANALVQQRDQLENQLTAAKANNVELQRTIVELTTGTQQDSGQRKELTAQLVALQLQVKDQQQTIEQQQELLAHDRDIRELMGARDLYIAEVYDVAGGGVNKKPYGRLFYTKGKSLIFYAYDLDQNKGLKNDATFQAWGRRGPDWNKALNLGMFYEDSAAKKRWVLRFDDPKTLAQIDAVFVTVEPNGGSQKPSGQHLLFAYLKIEPNHP